MISLPLPTEFHPLRIHYILPLALKYAVCSEPYVVLPCFLYLICAFWESNSPFSLEHPGINSFRNDKKMAIIYV